MKITNAKLKEILRDIILDDEELNNIIILEGDEFAGGAVGISQDNHVIYDCEKLIESLMSYNNWTFEEAIEWINYNTLRALPYMKNNGKEPIIIVDKFENYLED